MQDCAACDGEEVMVYAQAAKPSLIFMLVNILGILASIPFRSLMGLM